MPGQWADSDRRSTLPPDWATRIQPRILARDNLQCTWLGDLDNDGRPSDYITAVHLGITHQLLNRCPSKATDVDHIGDREDHSDEKLRSLCGWHHDRRSSRQGNTAKAKRAAQRLRPAAEHPGIRKGVGGHSQPEHRPYREA
jgi:5-methylcytosine-specific restriction protein A